MGSARPEGLLSNRAATRAGAVGTAAGTIGLVAEAAVAGLGTTDGRVLLGGAGLAAALFVALLALPWRRWRPESLVWVLVAAMVVATLPVLAQPRAAGWLPLLPCWIWGGLAVPDRARLAAVPALLAAVAVPVLVTGAPLPALQVLAGLVVVGGSGEALALASARAVRARERAERAEARAAVLLTHAPGVVVVLALSGPAGPGADVTVREVSDGTARALGTLEPGASVLDVVHPDDALLAREVLARAVQHPGTQVETELRLRRADGAWRRLASTVTAVPEAADGAERGDGRGTAILSAVDVTAERDALDHALREAGTDALTGLASRTAIRAAIDAAHLRLAADPAPRDCGVLAFVDLDGFKLVNDRLGHAVGDRLLVRVADRLRGLTVDGCVVGRLSGDEFAVLDPARPAAGGEAFGAAVLAALLGVERLDGHDLAVSASVGVAALRADGGTDELLRRADVAMYRAKARGGGRALGEDVTGAVPRQADGAPVAS